MDGRAKSHATQLKLKIYMWVLPELWALKSVPRIMAQRFLIQGLQGTIIVACGS